MKATNQCVAAFAILGALLCPTELLAQGDNLWTGGTGNWTDTTWSFDGMPCANDGSAPGCYHHPSNQFLLIAKGNGDVMACAADDIPVNESSCGRCRISESSGECQ